MESTGAVGACLDHPERSGTPCSRCGTFRCGACLAEGVCPLCLGSSQSARRPQSEDAVGFGRRAGGRLIDLLVGQAAGIAGGVMSAIVLAILEATGVARAGWAQRFEHGFGFSFLSGTTASLLGMALSTWVGGASAGKLVLGMRVVRDTGERAGFFSGLVRELAYFIDALFFGLVAKSLMDGSPLQQRLGDQWAKTVVVHARTIPTGVAASMGVVVLGVGLGLFVQAMVLAAFFVVAAA